MSANRDRCTNCTARTLAAICPGGSKSLDRLAGEGVTHVFRRGQYIFHAGTPAQSMHVIRSGRVKIVGSCRNGEELVLRLLGCGEIIGYRPVLAGERYNASAEVIEETSVCIFPAAAVREALRADPRLALELLAKLARELRLSEELMMELVHRPVRQRAARMLLGLMDQSQPDGTAGVITGRDLQRKDMARMIGTTPETLSRVLRDFARRGLIALTRDTLRVRDTSQLRRVADAGARAT